MANSGGYGMAPNALMYSRQSQSRKPAAVNIVLGLLILLTAGTFITIYLLRSGDGANRPQFDQSSRLRDRNVDSKSFGVTELFPQATLTVEDRRYTVLLKENTQRCARAAIGPLIDVLDKYECKQVVRGTVRDDSNQFLVTLGIVNVADAPSAAEIDNLLQNPSVNGAFIPLTSPEIAPDLTNNKKVVDRDHLGHYVFFVTVTKPQTPTFEAGDPAVTRILKDSLTYLKDAVEKRAAAV